MAFPVNASLVSVKVKVEGLLREGMLEDGLAETRGANRGKRGRQC